MKLNLKRSTNKVFMLLLLAVFTLNTTDVFAQKKQVLQIEDVKLWRNHYSNLSPDGKWYVLSYQWTDRDFNPESKSDSKKGDSKKSDDFSKLYSKDNQNGFLYIGNEKDGIVHRIEKGQKPTFSDDSKWVAYIIDHKSDKKSKEKNKLELLNLIDQSKKTFEFDGNFWFTDDNRYFVSYSDQNISLLDLESNIEHFVGNVDHYVFDHDNSSIIYTVNTKDRRGNGVYLYNPNTKTTQAIYTNSLVFGGLMPSNSKNDIVFYTYTKNENEVDSKSFNIVKVTDYKLEKRKVHEYAFSDFKVDNANLSLDNREKLTWSDDDSKLFVKLSDYSNKKEENNNNSQDESTVQVWHWNDSKILSQRMLEKQNERSQKIDAIVDLENKKLVQISDQQFDRVFFDPSNTKWAFASDNSKYISDWDVYKSDIYRIDLKNGNKKLIYENNSRFFYVSPDNSKLLIWDGKDYLAYDPDSDNFTNISQNLEISFVNTNFDKYGSSPNYGFSNWVKGNNSVILNHKYDLWRVYLDGVTKAENLTSSVTSNEPIRFRVDNLGRDMRSNKVEDKYLDLSQRIFLNGVNLENKHEGFFVLENNKLERLIFQAASFGISSFRGGILKAKNSDVIIFKRADIENYPESYLSDLTFKKELKISNTNPQQKNYRWGKRILISYTNKQGVPLQGVLTIPEDYKKGQKRPMVIYSYEKMSQDMFIHPAPYLSGAALTEMLYVSDGYLYLQPDIHFNVGTPHSDMHESLEAAINKVIELGYVDEKRIGYEGFSYGGHTGMFVSTQNNKFAAIAAGAGVSNLVQGFSIDIVGNGSGEQDYYMTDQGRLGVDPVNGVEMYIRESPVFHSNNMNTPLLVFHGTEDNVVKWEHSFGFYNVLRYLKKPVVFLSYRQEGHGFRKIENRIDIQKRLKAFFDHYLKGAEAEKWMVEELPVVLPNKDDSKSKTSAVSEPWK